jgi:hypothetical protein
MRAHGAWVQLFAAIGAGALVGTRGRVEVALLVGTAYLGGYRFFAAWVRAGRRRLHACALGGSVALAAGAGALALGADPRFLAVAGAGLVVAPAAVLSVRRQGLLSRATLVAGTGVLATGGAACAVAGAASWWRAAALLGLLWGFFAWRSVRVSGAFQGLDRDRLRRRGLQEAALAATWSLLVSWLLRGG